MTNEKITYIVREFNRIYKETPEKVKELKYPTRAAQKWKDEEGKEYMFIDMDALKFKSYVRRYYQDFRKRMFTFREIINFVMSGLFGVVLIVMIYYNINLRDSFRLTQMQLQATINQLNEINLNVENANLASEYIVTRYNLKNEEIKKQVKEEQNKLQQLENIKNPNNNLNTNKPVNQQQPVQEQPKQQTQGTYQPQSIKGTQTKDSAGTSAIRVPDVDVNGGFQVSEGRNEIKLDSVNLNKLNEGLDEKGLNRELEVNF